MDLDEINRNAWMKRRKLGGVVGWVDVPSGLASGVGFRGAATVLTEADGASLLTLLQGTSSGA